MSAWISSLCVPVAVIAGGADALVPLARAQEMAERFPNCQFTVIPQAGHMPMLEAPEEVANALAALVSRVNKGLSLLTL
jgi:pimeloyl-ACP methyl ester carboxylesterase